MLEEKNTEAKGMTEFGRTLYSLMLTRGLEHRQDLLAVLPEEQQISQSKLSYYMNGDRNVDPRFLANVVRALGLNREEKRRLAWAFAYGQLHDEGA